MADVQNTANNKIFNHNKLNFGGNQIYNKHFLSKYRKKTRKALPKIILVQNEF